MTRTMCGDKVDPVQGWQFHHLRRAGCEHSPRPGDTGLLHQPEWDRVPWPGAVLAPGASKMVKLPSLGPVKPCRTAVLFASPLNPMIVPDGLMLVA